MPLDDQQVRDRLLDATEACIRRRGDTQIRMAQVADEAGVARSTVYRYYPSRDDLLLELVLRRVDQAMRRWIEGLAHPDDAAASIRELILRPVAAVHGDLLNEALYARDSSSLTAVLDQGADAVTDVVVAQLRPLFSRWKKDGQLNADLNLRDTAEWMSATTSFLLTTRWRGRPAAAKRRFVDRYVIRALVTL